MLVQRVPFEDDLEPVRVRMPIVFFSPIAADQAMLGHEGAEKTDRVRSRHVFPL